MTDNDLYQQNDNFVNEQQNADEQIEEDVKPIILPSVTLQTGGQNDDPMEGTSQERDMNDKNNNDEANIESPSTRDSFIFKCILCDRVLTANDEPKLLECLHNACSSCVRNKLYYENVNSNKELTCTICGITSKAENIIENQFLLDQSAVEDSTPKFADLKCSSCSDDANATSWCVDCSEFICDNCVQAHQRLKITKDHTIKLKEEGIQENQSNSSNLLHTHMYCTIHPHEKLSLFCENCDKLTCRDCQLTEHRQHKYKFTHEIASDTRKQISNILKDISYKRVLLNSATKVISDRQQLINERKQALVKEITHIVVRLTNSITVRGKELVTKVTKICGDKQHTLEEKKQALQQISKMTDHCIEFIQNALDNGTDMALLYSKKHVTDHLQRVKCKRADIPNPEIPVRINLAFDKMPDLIKVLSNIGQIVVDGRLYPSQPTSPAVSTTPQNSPSPGQSNSLVQQPCQQQPHQPQSHQQQAHQQQAHQQQPHQQQSHQQQPHQHQQQQQQQQQQQHQHQQQLQQQSTQSPLSQALQQPLPPNYQAPRMLPPYGQQYSQTMQMNMQNNANQTMQQSNMSHNMNQSTLSNMNIRGQSSQMMGQNMNIPPAIPISMAPQYQQNMPNHLQRPPMQRPINIRPMPPHMANRLPNSVMNNQQQVTSSTHPHSMMSDRNNLRGLLQPNGGNVFLRGGPNQYQSMQPQYAQQFQSRFSTPVQLRPQIRMGMPIQRPNAPNINRPAQAQPQGIAKWHIPQQYPESVQNNNNYINKNVTLTPANDNFKITLKSPNQGDGRNSSVTSTIPKTPSPNSTQANTGSLDKYCEDSVKDLMATIAKLDSNGVQVLAENRNKTGDSPHVDSSTGDISSCMKNKTESSQIGKDDPNEDWCAVCMDGGELVCCDKCPKVFHQYCHIPNLSVEENDTWQCLLCMNFADIPDNVLGEKKEGELSGKERKVAERLVLELYCQYDPSIPFREVIGPENTDYHSIIKKPMALDMIRSKLDWNAPHRYTNLEQLVRDVRLMLKNAYIYNAPESIVYNNATVLEKFFDEQLEKWLPEYAYETFEEDNIQPPTKKYRRIICD